MIQDKPRKLPASTYPRMATSLPTCVSHIRSLAPPFAKLRDIAGMQPLLSPSISLQDLSFALNKVVSQQMKKETKKKMLVGGSRLPFLPSGCPGLCRI